MRRRVAWVVVTTIAYALGMTASVLVLNAVARPIGGVLGGLLFVVLFGAAIGLAVAAVQLLALVRVTVARGRFVLATAAGAAVGFTIASIVGEFLASVISPTTNIVIGGGTIQDLSGAAAGLCIGYAQWRVLRGTLDISRSWVWATAIGVGLGYGSAAGVLELLEVEILKVNLIPSYGGIVGLGAGIAQAIALWRSREHVRA